MRKSLSILLSLALGALGCSSPKKKDSLQEPVTWEMTEGLSDLKCYDWPQSNKDLAIDQVFLSNTHDFSFAISQHRSRKNTRAYKLISLLDAPKLSIKKFKPITIKEDAAITGIFRHNKKNYLSMEGPEGQLIVAKLRLKPSYNISLSLAADIYNTQVKGFGEELWLQYQQEDDDRYYVQKLELKGNTMNLRGSPVGLASKPRLLQLGHTTFAIYAKPGGFYLKSLKRSSKPIKVLTVKKPIESWDVVSQGKSLLLSYIAGDSLIEGLSQLHIMKLAFNAKSIDTTWKKSIELTDRHVSQPRWFYDKKLSLNLTQWIDDKAVLARYFFSGPVGQFEMQRAGTLKNRQYILGFTKINKKKKPVFLSRTKGKNFWQFEVCEL